MLLATRGWGYGNTRRKGLWWRRISVAVTLTLLVCIEPAVAVTIEEGVFTAFATVDANSSSIDEQAHIVSTGNKTVIVAGTTAPLERGTESDLGKPLHDGLREEDFFIAKISTDDGIVHWVYRGGTSKEERLQALLLDKGGKYIFVAGRTFGTFSGTKRVGQADIFVIKYDISGDVPKAAWEAPLILGTTASDAVTSLAFDPRDENLVYATGFTSGNLFPGKAVDASGLSDAILFSFASLDGTVVHKVQFGSQYADQGTGLVVSEKENGPIFVSVITDRQIGQYAFGNFHMYKFKRDASPLGDLLLRTYSREQMASFRHHPMLPGTLIVSGSSWLDTRNGYDVFIKRIVRIFDDSDIGSKEVDIDEVSDDEYTKRIQSPDGSHDYATGMIVDPESGRLIVSGYTGGAFAPGSKMRGLVTGFMASIDPIDASLTDAKQIALKNESSWVEITCITMATGKRGLYYVAKESNETSTHFFLQVGAFGFPATWKTQISIAPSPDPTPSPKRDQDKTNVEEKENDPIAIIAGSVCGAVVLISTVIALVMYQRMRKRTKGPKPDSNKQSNKSQSKPKARVAPISEQVVEGGNASGLV